MHGDTIRSIAHSTLAPSDKLSSDQLPPRLCSIPSRPPLLSPTTADTPPLLTTANHRVKSLVREYDEIVKSPPLGSPNSPPISPDSALGPSSPSPSPSPTHVRRAASISYSSSSSSSPTSFYLSSTSAAAGPSKAAAAFAPVGSMRRSPDPFSQGAAPAPGGAHKRKGSVNTLPTSFALSSSTGRNGTATARKPMSLAEELNGHSLSGGIEEEDEAMRKQEEEEEQDVFLPLSSPTSASPYQVKFGTPTPTSPNFILPSQPSQQPTTTTTTAAKADHARSHSRIHERNLSAFFPRPGQQGVGYGDTYEDPLGKSIGVGGTQEVPTAAKSSTPPGGGSPGDSRAAAGRRGHHHRHSMSHNFFSFMDPTMANPGGSEMGLAPSPELYTPTSSRTVYPSPTPTSTSFLPTPSHFHTAGTQYSSLPAPLRLLLFTILYLPPTTQLFLLISVTQIILGATLWILGQGGESLSVTGLGYLVVFDGMGALSGVLVEGGRGVEEMWRMLRGSKGEKGVRLPYGTTRLVTLSHFSQAIYLLFSAVYVCKESVEHVLLLHGGTDEEGAHGSGHGGMGHGEGLSSSGSAVEGGISIPIVLLGLAASISLLSAIAMRNHQTLTDAVGPSGLSFRTRTRSRNPTLVDRIGNPFTLTVVAFCVGLVLAAFTIPGPQLAPLDKVVALLQSIAMFYVAYPAAVATGQVLLQTAPPPHLSQMTSLQSGLRDIENHPMVVSLSPPHIWQLTPHPASSDPDPSSSAPAARTRTTLTEEESATIISTLSIQIKMDASDADILALTKFAHDRCAAALNLPGGRNKERGRKGPPGELTVAVTRAPRASQVNFYKGPKGTMSGEGGHDGHSHSHATEAGHGHHH